MTQGKPTPKPTPLRKQQTHFTRQRLIDAARELFARDGTRGTSVDDIARAAGTSRATFYAHFSDKRDVIRELTREMWEQVSEVYGAFGKLKDWSHPSVRGWMKLVFKAWDERATSTAVVVQEAAHELETEFLIKLQDRIEAIMSNPEAWTDYDPGEAERRVGLLIFQLERTMAAVHFGKWPVDRSALLETLTDIWVTTLETGRKAGAAKG